VPEKRPRHHGIPEKKEADPGGTARPSPKYEDQRKKGKRGAGPYPESHIRSDAEVSEGKKREMKNFVSVCPKGLERQAIPESMRGRGGIAIRSKLKKKGEGGTLKEFSRGKLMREKRWKKVRMIAVERNKAFGGKRVKGIKPRRKCTQAIENPRRREGRDGANWPCIRLGISNQERGKNSQKRNREIPPVRVTKPDKSRSKDQDIGRN